MNTTQDDGGPAFPTQGFDQGAAMSGIGVTVTDKPGMSLRDWFAGNERIGGDETFSWELCNALAGPRPDKDEKTDPIGWEIWQATWQAKIKFSRADAMIAARKEQP